MEALMGPLTWMLVLGILAVLMDAMGRRKGEPDAPARPDAHAEVERWLRENSAVFARSDRKAGPNRI